MSKNIAAINITNREQFGQSQYLSKYSSQLVELMRPVALQANSQLYSDTYQSIVQQAEAMVDNGFLDKFEVQNYVNKAFELYKNPIGTLQNGQVGDKMTVFYTMQSGGLDNPAEYLNQYRNTVASAYASGNTITNNIVGNAWGLPNFRNVNVNKAGDVQNAINKTSTKTEIQLQDIYDAYVKNADDFNTKTDQWNKLFENSTTWLGDIKTALGEIPLKIADVLIKSIAAYFGGKFLLHFAGSSIGKAITGTASAVGGETAVSGGSSALGILGTIVGGVTLGVGAANIIKGAIESASRKEDEKNISAEASILQGTSLEGNKAAEILGGMATSAQKENNNFGSKLGAAWNTTTRWLGVGTLGWSRNLAQINNDDFGFFKEKLKMLGEGPSKSGAKDALLAWTLLLASANRLSDIQEFNGISNADLKAMVEASGVAPSSWDKYLENTIKKVGYLPNKTEKEDQTYIDWKKLGIEYHRYGLDEVPYDNYPAMLHQGEAVLTANTANELRNLLDEYKNNNQATANLEAVVNQQTNDLCNKLNEVVVAISRIGVSNGISTMASLDQAKAQNLLKNSMLHIRSTKDALN